MVDTCAAEFPASTPYFYSTHDTQCEIERSDRKKVLILGSGPIRIGQGIEFDYCTVHAVKALRDEGVEVHIVNNNPETVSTDFDTSDRLFFEPMQLEDVMNILKKDNYYGVMVQFGGQNAVNLAMPIHEEIKRLGLDTRILGTSPDAMDVAEDRDRFSVLLDRIRVPSPPNRLGILTRGGPRKGRTDRVPGACSAQSMCSAGVQWRSCTTRSSSRAI